MFRVFYFYRIPDSEQLCSSSSNSSQHSGQRKQFQWVAIMLLNPTVISQKSELQSLRVHSNNRCLFCSGTPQRVRELHFPNIQNSSVLNSSTAGTKGQIRDTFWSLQCYKNHKAAMNTAASYHANERRVVNEAGHVEAQSGRRLRTHTFHGETE